MTCFAFFAKIGFMKAEDISVIGKLLAKAGKSKSDLAKCWGRDPSAATAFFKGEREIVLDELDKTALLLGMSTTELVAKLRGEKLQAWDDELYTLALKRAKQVVDSSSAKLNGSAFAEYVYLLYKHALSEKRTEGEASLTLATAELLLNQKLIQAN
jgi:hypothetical protein